MRFSKKMTLGLAAITMVSALTTQTNAEHTKTEETQRHLDRLAVIMQGQSRELIREFGLHYRRKSGYAHLRADAWQLYRAVTHIHTVVHHSGDVHHLKSDVERADKIFHHLEEVLDKTELSLNGTTQGDTIHVLELMEELEKNLHHLQTDVDKLDEDYHQGIGPRHVGRVNPYHGSYHETSFRNVHSGYEWCPSVRSYSSACVNSRWGR
jgi:hypothetical protein